MRTFLSIIALSLVAFGCTSKSPTTLVVEENSPIVGPADTTVEVLGIETLGGVLTTIIPLGTKIPYSRTQIFSTASDGQTQLSIKLFRGVNIIAADNQKLGEFQVTDIPSAPRGTPQIEITFGIIDRQIVLSARDLRSNSDLQVQKLAVVPDSGDARNMEQERDTSNITAKERSQFVPVAKGIERASSLTLYQGLPGGITVKEKHPIEPDIVETERDTTETLRIHGYDFYKQPLTVTEEEIEPLRHLSSDDRTFGLHTKKFCGAFHPDYCLVWKDGRVTYHLLICFSCDEAKFFGPRSYVILDIYKVNVLKSILLLPRGQRSRS